MYRYFFILALCAYSLAQSQTIDSLKIGSGGGFSGHTIVYKLEKNKIKKGTGLIEVNYTEKANLCGKKKKTLLKCAQEIISLNIDLNEPGNTYEFLEIYTKDKIYKIVWSRMSGPDLDPAFYKNVESMKNVIHKLKFNSI